MVRDEYFRKLFADNGPIGSSDNSLRSKEVGDEKNEITKVTVAMALDTKYS